MHKGCAALRGPCSKMPQARRAELFSLWDEDVFEEIMISLLGRHPKAA